MHWGPEVGPHNRGLHGRGTGSGLGTYLLGALADEYPKTYRFVTAVFPAADDDVITSPYNA